MNSSKLDAIDLIQNEGELPALAAVLRQTQTLAVDTESNSLYAFQERVCLIQFSTLEQDFMLDPLAMKNLSVLGPVFGDPQIEKVFHAAEYDLICLRRDFGFEVRNLFDTMAAARILGRTEIGLGSLLEMEFGVKVEKRYQRANWGQRPLPVDLLEYARLDTHYLIALRDRLEAELVERNLLALAKEDFQRQTLNGATENGANNGESNGAPVRGARSAGCWRISGSFDLSPQQAAVLQALCEYREEVARQLDRPLFKVINDETLLRVAAETPHSMDDLRRLPGMSDGQVRRHGQGLLRAVTRGLSAQPIRPPRPQRPDPAIAERMDLLRNWRKLAAAKMGVPSDVVLPRDLIILLARENPRSMNELELVLSTVPWRLEHFGEEILRVLCRSKSG